MRKLNLANYIAMVLIGLVAVSTLVISGILYVFLSESLTREFEERVRSAGNQAFLALDFRLDHVQARVRELSQDGTIRVSLILGDDQQLQEYLTLAYGSEKETVFYVARAGQGKIFNSGPGETDNGRIEKLLYSAPHARFITRDEQGRFTAAYSLPITVESKVLGTAGCGYHFKEGMALSKLFGSETVGRMVVLEGAKASDLFSGAALEAPAEELEAIRRNKFGYLSLNGVEGLAVSREQLPDLLFFVSLAKLNNEKRKVFFLIFSLTFGFICSSAIISLYVGQKLGQPLKKISAMALDVAEGEVNLWPDTIKSNITEVDQLASSLGVMLSDLRAAEELKRYQELFDGVADAVFIIDFSGGIREVNWIAMKQFGFQRSEFLQMNTRDLVVEEQHQGLQRVSDDLQNGEDQMIFEAEFRTREGKRFFGEVHARRTLFQDEEVILSVVRDITSRKESETALRVSEEKYRTILEKMDEIYFEVDLAGSLTFFNQSFWKITKYSEEELMGLNFRAFMEAEEAKKVFERYNHVYRTGQPALDLEYEVIDKQGERITLRVSASLIKNASGEPIGFRGVALDITERVKAEAEKARLEKQLLHAQKMEAIGRLASGVAHDFNNLLQAISGYIQLLLAGKEQDPKTRRYLTEVDGVVDRAAALVRQLLTFSRKVDPELKPLDVNLVVHQAIKMLERTLPKMIRIETSLSEGLRPIIGDSVQLEQILMNLGSNAMDAMPEGGWLAIETEAIILDEDFCRNNLGAKPGDYICLTITDNGFGMDRETLEHIFDPFYTTKEIGRGTGLGLAMVYGIVKAHDGYITCDSRPDQGTVFRIYLPAGSAGEVHKDDETAAQTGAVYGNETILLVDDEETVLNITRDILELNGYIILTATSGEAALDLYKKHGRGIDLVIMDVGMPGIGGHGCLKKLLELNPEVKVIIASGYAADEQVKKTLELGARGFLSKPFRLTTLVKEVRKVLDGV